MSNDSLIGKRLANFRIERLLGRGGMAQVYFGRDMNLQRPVAIKVINASFRSDPGYAERFINEARAVATWRHENIVQVYHADKSDGLYFFVMEYIDGMDLASLLRDYADAGELMPHSDVVQIGKAVASALDYAHARNVIHRDVKPANVMVSTDDRVVLMDFGLALDIQQGSIGEVLGTPHYASPEQVRRSADAVPQSDVYSLGVMFYEMLTGIVPFDDSSPTAIALQHLSSPPPPPRSLNPDLNQQVEDVLLKALEKEPGARYSTATELVRALEDALAQNADALLAADLPPMPPDITPPNRSMSGKTVAERLALNIRSRRTQFAADVPRRSATVQAEHADVRAVTREKPRSGSRGLLLLIPLVALLLIVGGLLLLTNRNGADLAPSPTAVSEASTDNAVVAAVATESTAPTAMPATIMVAFTVLAPISTALPPTATPVLPTNTPPPLSPTEPPTTAPTATEVLPTPADIPLPTAVPILLEPTVLYPDGRRVQLFWNGTSFYWHNPTGNSVRVSPISFQALDANGNPTGYALAGSRWTIGYSSVEPGRCVAVELLQTSDWLRPGECRSGYNAQLTLQRSSNEVFWLDRDNTQQFRVLWNGAEVGRCMIAAQTCEVRIP